MTKWLSRKSNDASTGKKWLHPAETLRNSQVTYTVKLYGMVDAAGAKGIEVVRDAMQKTKFNRQLLKADGVKCPKVEIMINVENVTVRNAKTKVEMHKFPLQQLSYCADDKAERRLFAFVARETSSNSHKCFVFDSEKCAEEITLTIGQAFELAYQRFLEEKPIESLKTTYSSEINELKQENLKLKDRISQLEGFICAHGHQIPPMPSECTSNGKSTSNGNGNGNNVEAPGLTSVESSTSIDRDNERYISLPANKTDELLIESLSFTSSTALSEENGKSGTEIPALPPPTVPVRNMSRNNSMGDTQSPTKAPPSSVNSGATQASSSVVSSAIVPVAPSATARPRPQPRQTSETNPFKSSEFPTVQSPPPSAAPAKPAPVACLVDSSWPTSTGHVAALADFDPLSIKTAN